MAELKLASIVDIILIDGGSTDGSLAVDTLQDLEVRGLLVKTGPGKLSAQLRCAYAFALDHGYDGIVTIDGNDKDDPEAIPRFIDALNDGVDFVQASRFISGGTAENTPKSRDIAIRFIHAPTLSLASGYRWTDTTQGFRGYSRKMLLDPRIAPFRDIFSKYELLAYLSCRVPQCGFRCLELPTVRRYPKGEVPTKISSFKGNLELIAVLFSASFGFYNTETDRRTFRYLETNEKIATVVSSGVFSVLVLMLCLRLTSAPKYTDFIVGAITWSADPKLQDMIIAPVVIFATWVSVAFFSFLLNRLKTTISTETASELSSHLIWWSLPAATTAAAGLLNRSFGLGIAFTGSASPLTNSLSGALTPFLISTFGISYVSVSSLLSSKTNKRIAPQVHSLTAFAFILIALIPTEFALVDGRMLSTAKASIATSTYFDVAYVIALLTWLVGVALAVRGSKIITRVLPLLLTFGQLGLLAMIVFLFPARLVQPDGTITNYPTTIWLKIVIAGLGVLGLGDLIRRFWKYSKTTILYGLISPIAIWGLFIGIKVSGTTIPNLNPDDYHFGETLLGWWSYTKGALPYIDHVPAHGLVEDNLNQFLSSFLYDGTVGTFTEAARIGFSLLALATLLSVYFMSDSIGLAFVSAFFVGYRSTWLHLAVFTCLWLSPAARKSPSRWLTIWILTSPLVILGGPPQGLLLVASSCIMAAYYVWRMIQDPKQRKWQSIAFSLALLTVIGFLTPLGRILFSAVFYVIENGPINQIAYGVPWWGRSWDKGYYGGFLFELLRMSWIATPLACLSVVHACFKDPKQRIDAYLPAIVILLFSLLLIPYSMGRIDYNGSISRPGMAAILGWAMLLPAAVWGILSTKNKAPFVLVVSCVCATLTFSPVSLAILQESASPKVSSPFIRDAAKVGLKHIGKVVPNEDHWNRLIGLNRLLNANLRPNETYLDLTNRNAQYFYLDRMPIVPVSAPYNIPSPDQQRRMVETLTRNVPRVALLEGGNNRQDGGGIALRNFVLFRFVVDTYDPSAEDGFIIGYKRAQAPQNAENGEEIHVKNHLTDENWLHGLHRREAAFVVSDPSLLPLINVGDDILIGSNDKRRIVRLTNEHSIVWLEGPPLGPADGTIDRVFLLGNTQRVLSYKQLLLKRALSQSEIASVPIAWGESVKSLTPKMKSVRKLGLKAPIPYQMVPGKTGFKTVGTDPQLIYNVSTLKLSGRKVGLIKFNFKCIGKVSDPMLEVFWSGDNDPGFSQENSIRFDANNGVLIVPVDISPHWLNLKLVKEIRIDLHTPSACNETSIRNLEFLERN
jgi:hypothetical protein